MSKVDILLLDKTGTLTSGNMRLSRVFCAGQVWSLVSNKQKKRGGKAFTDINFE